MLKFKVHNIQIVFLSGLRTKHKKNRIHATKLSVLQFMNSKRIVPVAQHPTDTWWNTWCSKIALQFVRRGAFSHSSLTRMMCVPHRMEPCPHTRTLQLGRKGSFSKISLSGRISWVLVDWLIGRAFKDSAPQAIPPGFTPVCMQMYGVLVQEQWNSVWGALLDMGVCITGSTCSMHFNLQSYMHAYTERETHVWYPLGVIIAWNIVTRLWI